MPVSQMIFAQFVYQTYTVKKLNQTNTDNNFWYIGENLYLISIFCRMMFGDGHAGRTDLRPKPYLNITISSKICTGYFWDTLDEKI